jgi:hypothetical protein
MTIKLIELLVYPVLVFLATTLTAKLIERQGDVLYGPYIQGRKTTASIFASAIIGGGEVR